MAEEINVRVKHKGMTLAEWNKSTVILMERELGVATDTGEVRVGNGTDRWTSLPIIKGEKGEPLKVESTTKNSQGDTVIKFDDGSSATVSKGDKGDSITVSSHKKDGQGNTVINFSDGSNVTVDKGDSITVESTSTDRNGNTLVKFSDGSSATIAKGDKGDPLTFDDLTQEQINQIKAQDVDLSNYAKKDHKHKVRDVDGLQNELAMVQSNIYNGVSQYITDVSQEIANKADEKHTHEIADVDGLQKELKTKASLTHYHDIEDINNLKTALNGKAPSDHKHKEYVTNVGVNRDGNITCRINNQWSVINTSYKRPLAFKDHTHDEYLKKGDPIELTPTQKAELKGEPGKQGLPGQAGKGIVNTRTGTELKYWAGSQADYNKISIKDPNTVYDVWE